MFHRTDIAVDLNQLMGIVIYVSAVSYGLQHLQQNVINTFLALQGRDSGTRKSSSHISLVKVERAGKKNEE